MESNRFIMSKWQFPQTCESHLCLRGFSRYYPISPTFSKSAVLTGEMKPGFGGEKILISHNMKVGKWERF